MNNQNQRGIDWQGVRGLSGFGFTKASGGTPAGIKTNAFTMLFGTGPEQGITHPNPSLANPCGVPVPAGGCNIPGISSLIPEIQTREMESVMRVQSGQTAVLGGLIQDSVSNIEDGIPGVNRIPGVGQLLAQRKDLNQ